MDKKHIRGAIEHGGWKTEGQLTKLIGSGEEGKLEPKPQGLLSHVEEVGSCSTTDKELISL